MFRILRTLLPLLLLPLFVQGANALDATRVTDGCIPLVELVKADFDGDQREDYLLGATTSIPNAYRSLLVRTADGRTLLDITDAGYYYFVKVVDIGAPNPIILAGTPFGNKWLHLEAWMYFPEKGFQQVMWDSSLEIVGLIQGVDQRRGEIYVTTPEGRKTYQYSNGALSARSAHQ